MKGADERRGQLSHHMGMETLSRVIHWGRECEPQPFRRALWREEYLLGVPEHVETWILLEVRGSMYKKPWKHALAPGGGRGTLAPTRCQPRSGHPVPSLQGFCAPPGIPGERYGKAPRASVYVGGTFKHDLEIHSFCLGET